MILAIFQTSGIIRMCIEKSNSLVRSLIVLLPIFLSMSIDSPLGPMVLDGLALLMAFATADYSKNDSCRSLLRFLSVLNIALLHLFCIVGCLANCLQNFLAHFLPSICCQSPNSIAERFLPVTEPDRFLIVLQSVPSVLAIWYVCALSPSGLFWRSSSIQGLPFILRD